MRIDLLESWEQCRSLRGSWESLFNEDNRAPLGLGPVCSHAFSEALWNSPVGGTEPVVIVLRDAGDVVGILALARDARSSSGARSRNLRMLADRYPGRCGFLIRDASPRYLGAMLEFVQDQVEDWDTLSLGVVSGSRSERALKAILEDGRYRYKIHPGERSPYIALPDDFSAYLKVLRKKFRYQVRHTDKALAEHHGVLTTYRRPDEMRQYLKEAYAIERMSWKEAAGTSITANPIQDKFHRILGPLMAERGWFRGDVLKFDGEPVAHMFGLTVGGVFYNLKHSYVERFASNSPGTILNSLAVRSLIEEGVRTYDYVGPIEPHKMKWTDLTYGRTTYTLYRNTLRGRFIHFRSRLARILRRDPPT